ncbi:MAG: hypothetical protein LBU06_05705 [Desulfovibrio sp.]|jgi:phospholipase C|nr:hypothetical protein [Desulfovibrio sp.]
MAFPPILKSGSQLNPSFGTVEAAADTIVARDANGRAQISPPALAAEIANKGYVDEVVPPAAGAAAADADGTRGTAVYARDGDAASRDKAATPAGVAAQINANKPLAVKAWALVDGGSPAVVQGKNVTSVARTATGRFTVYSPEITEQSCVVVSSLGTASYGAANVNALAAGSAVVHCFAGGSAFMNSFFSIVVLGD